MAVKSMREKKEQRIMARMQMVSGAEVKSNWKTTGKQIHNYIKVIGFDENWIILWMTEYWK